jgi:hypothetical protein
MEKKGSWLTREQILQSHSPITSSSLLSGPLVFNAIVTAPQWQDPVYSLLFSISAEGSGPRKGGGLYAGSNAAPSCFSIPRDQRSTS